MTDVYPPSRVLQQAARVAQELRDTVSDTFSHTLPNSFINITITYWFTMAKPVSLQWQNLYA